MLRTLYDKVMALSGSRHATPWLAVISFAESSFFPIPPDVMLAPMVLARPERAWKLAAVCTLASVLGGCLGYAIGFYFADFGLKILALFGHASSLAEFRAWYDKFGLAVILVKGLTPIPYKLVTIASGLAAFSFPAFIIASVITRGARFFLVAGLLKYFGPQVREMVEKRLALATAIGVAMLVAVYAVMHYLK